jgi:hypothetical protein
MMPSPETQELEQLISQLTDATRTGLVSWRAVNPTTFIWDKPELGGVTARITLQRVDRQVVSTPPGRIVMQQAGFILQGLEIRGGQGFQKITINSQSQPELTQKLQELFQLVSTGLSRQGLDFLRDIIPKSGT